MRNKYFRFFGLMVVLSFLLSLSSIGCHKKGTEVLWPGYIKGCVTDASSGQGIVGATIAYSGPQNGSVLTLSDTNCGASYCTPPLTPGTYTVTASFSGYKTSNASVTVYQNTFSKQDFKLQKQ